MFWWTSTPTLTLATGPRPCNHELPPRTAAMEAASRFRRWARSRMMMADIACSPLGRRGGRPEPAAAPGTQKLTVLVAFWVGFTTEWMSWAKATLLPLLLTVFWVWPISWETSAEKLLWLE